MKSAQIYDPSLHIPLMLKLRPIIEDTDNNGEFTTRLGVEPLDGNTLPEQGEEHHSVGTTTDGQKTKLVQFISFPAPPEIFDTVIFTVDPLTK